MAAPGWGEIGAGVRAGQGGRKEGGGLGLTKHCTVHADGAVEVRAASGNARLILSASRTMVEVDYAATAAAAAIAITEADSAIDPSRAAAGVGCGGGGRREVKRRERVARATIEGESRVWVSRRFLAGSCSSVPQEFAHALGVALTVSLSLRSAGEGRGMGAAGFGRVCEAEDWDGGGFVASELPRPEERPDHAR